MSGKGSRRRPMSISKEKFDKNWEIVFSKAEKGNVKEKKKNKTAGE